MVRRMVKRKLVTKAMITRAENAHFRTETTKSLDKHHALIYARAKQKGDSKLARYMASIPGVRRNAKKLGYTFK